MHRQAMSQEVVRLLRNTKETLTWSLKAETLSQFSLRMKDSEIIEGGSRAMIINSKGTWQGYVHCTVYMPGNWNIEERDKNKKIKEVSVYKPANAVKPPIDMSKQISPHRMLSFLYPMWTLIFQIPKYCLTEVGRKDQIQTLFHFLKKGKVWRFSLNFRFWPFSLLDFKFWPSS